MRSLSRVICLATLLAAPTVSALHAQTTTMSATATVVTPLTVAKAADLAYGIVYPGLDKVVSTASNPTLMGKFTISGYSGAIVNVSFALPTTLSSGALTLPIDTWNGYATLSSTPTGGTAFTPSGAVSPITLGGTQTTVFIGASVHPTYGQTAGSYTGTITMTTVYSGS